MTNDAVDVLWTGGWDSTFRIIQLLQETDAVIQPHYIVDRERSSNEVELSTMERLTKTLAKRLPDKIARLKKPLVVRRDDIYSYQPITDALRNLREIGHVGGQYDWLSRYAFCVIQTPLELSIEDSQHRSFAAELIHSNLAPCDGVSRYAIKENTGNVSTLFGPFRFPIIKYDKNAMRSQAEQWGLAHVLYDTWFCHFPLKGGYACGTCRPCVHIMDDAQKRRMGLPGRVRYQLIERTRRRVPSPAKNWLRQRAGKRIRRWLRS